jgi:hypothetical protein
MLDRALVINSTQGIISEVKVRHEPTGKIGAASMILPQKSFDLGFSQQPLLAKEATVTWIDQSGKPKRVEVSLPYESDGDSNILVYIIDPANKVHVTLEKSVVNKY